MRLYCSGHTQRLALLLFMPEPLVPCLTDSVHARTLRALLSLPHLPPLLAHVPSSSPHWAHPLGSVWCFTLPFVLVDMLQWRMIPLVFIAAWALSIIDEVGHLIEVRSPLFRFLSQFPSVPSKPSS